MEDRLQSSDMCTVFKPTLLMRASSIMRHQHYIQESRTMAFIYTHAAMASLLLA